MTIDLPSVALAGPLLVLLFGYAFRLIRRSDLERDRYVRRLEYDMEWWRAKALGLPPPSPPAGGPARLPDPAAEPGDDLA